MTRFRRYVGHMDTLSITPQVRWVQLPQSYKRDPRNNAEVYEMALAAAEAWQSEQIAQGVLSFSVIAYLVNTGTTRQAAHAIATEIVERSRGPDQVAPLLAACDKIFQDCGNTDKGVDNATRVQVLKLKAQLQGALAPKQSETRVTISVADELAKRTRALRERKAAEARVLDPVGPVPLLETVKTLVKDINTHG